MMVCLSHPAVVLVVRAVTLPGAEAGLAFYLIPDFGKLFAGDTPAEQMGHFGEAAYAAMGQAFFTLSLGIGSMEIFGSYIGKDRSLTGESLRICGLDTFVALMAGLIIFPACFAFGVEPDAGPGLVFVTLPSVFEQMPLGQLWCSLFFVFMSFAALSTIIAVFEGIIAFAMDQWGWSRGKSVAINGVLLIVLSLPCALGFNVWAGFQIPGIGDIQGIEDFIVSNNLLPLGSLIIVLFCTRKAGWGWDNFIAEADAGKGVKFPAAIYPWVKWGIPILIVIIFIMGYAPKFALWFGMGHRASSGLKCCAYSVRYSARAVRRARFAARVPQIGPGIVCSAFTGKLLQPQHLFADTFHAALQVHRYAQIISHIGFHVREFTFVILFGCELLGGLQLCAEYLDRLHVAAPVARVQIASAVLVGVANVHDVAQFSLAERTATLEREQGQAWCRKTSVRLRKSKSSIFE